MTSSYSGDFIGLVTLRPDSKFFSQCLRRHSINATALPDGRMVGKLYKNIHPYRTDEFPYRIRWSNGTSNTYRECDIIRLNQPNKEYLFLLSEEEPRRS